MGDWLREYNIADVNPFIEALEKTRDPYIEDDIDILKDGVSVAGITFLYVMNKTLKNKTLIELYNPGGCQHNPKWNEKERVENCDPTKVNSLLKTGMVGGPSIIFCRYAEKNITSIRFGEKKYQAVIGYDANSLYLYCCGQEMPCEKDGHVIVSDPNKTEIIIDLIIKNKLFGFYQVDIHVPDDLLKKFEEFSPLFIVDEIDEKYVPEFMKEYRKRTGRKYIPGSKKLLGVTKAEKILLYSPNIKWYLKHGLIITKIHQYIKYEPGTPFSWFEKEVASIRRESDKDSSKTQLGEIAKLKGNYLTGKMIENMERHKHKIHN